jgi:glycosyltransferase involved in cell wall biosynthesis
MDLVVDGLIYQMQVHGGISRIFNEVLPRMCNLDPDLNVTLFTSGLCLQRLPTHDQIHHYPPATLSRVLYPSRVWNRLIDVWLAPSKKFSKLSTSDSIWHSTYYTQPQGWNGKQIVTVVDMIQEKFPYLFSDAHNDQVRERKKRCIQSAHAVICISETTRQDVLEIYQIPIEKTHTVYLAHTPDFRVQSGTWDREFHLGSKPFILYVGARDEYKNFHLFVRAFQTWQFSKEIDLVAVGLPWTNEEQLLISELDLNGRVRVHSRVDDASLCWLYNHAVALIYPSLYEGFGIPLLEAMACGCPIVASQIESTREIAGEVPIYFDPKEIDDMEAALDLCVNEGRSTLRTKLGIEKAREYSWDYNARKTLEIYKSL